MCLVDAGISSAATAGSVISGVASRPDGDATISDVRASESMLPSAFTSATSTSVRPEMAVGIFSLSTGSAYKGTAQAPGPMA
jgi:hypothetical protein